MHPSCSATSIMYDVDRKRMYNTSNTRASDAFSAVPIFKSHSCIVDDARGSRRGFTAWLWALKILAIRLAVS